MNLAANLAAAQARHGHRAALRLGDTTVGYDELGAMSERVAARLRARGIRPGDRVGIMLPNRLEFAPAYFGVLRAGAVVVPMNPLLKRREVVHYLSDSAAALLLVSPECELEAQVGAAETRTDCIVLEYRDLEMDAASDGAIADRAAHETAVILYTTGTTGRPKGAELTHENLMQNVQSVTDLLALTPDDALLAALPLFHSFGQTCVLNAAVAVGASITLVPRFDPTLVLRLFEHDRLTVFPGVPTMYSALLNDPSRTERDCSALRICTSGGAALPVEVLRGFEAAFGCSILEGYGLSETSPVACFNHRDRERVPGSIGTPIAGVEMKVVDDARREVPRGEVGEIAIRGHNVMKGYWARPEATAEAIDPQGWFYTGDMARIDHQGRFYIVDRKKDMIIRGGYNVYPREIEEVLHEHPSVREVAVVGIPHEELGEEVGAAVALRDGATATASELRDHVREQLAAYKYPRQIWFVDELPKGPTGKILKRAIETPV